jgi:undecaprenyl-diphosphatase
VSVSPAIAPSSGDTVREVSGWRVWPMRRPAWEVLGIGLVGLFVIWTSAGLLFMALLDDGPVGDTDRRISRWFEDRRTPTINSLTDWGSMLSDTAVKVVLIAVVGGAMVVAWRRWHDGLLLALAVIVEATVFLFSSLLVDRGRPPVEQLDSIPPSGSFPSGHVAAAVAFYGGLYVVVCWHTANRAVRAVFLVIAVATPTVVALSRMARGMHHPVDVIAGALLGLAAIVVARRALAAGTSQIDREVASGELAAPDHVRRLDLSKGGDQ